MSTLSFVALSMQTTHLDPATVSQASYTKLVDGNITRVDAIPIIPHATASETGSHSPDEAVSWPDALDQLSMVFGKLPIVSYYRDADKEIFQAASRRSDITPPTFHWLDCRALARKLLPELSDHQPSTVLKALNLYDEYADSDTVEQTARIVLKLAQQQEATSIRELWDDLYHQPDDLLDLEATLQELSTSEAELNDDAEALGDDDSEGTPGDQAIKALGAGAAGRSPVGLSPSYTSDGTSETEPHQTPLAAEEKATEAEPVESPNACDQEPEVASHVEEEPESENTIEAPAELTEVSETVAFEVSDSTAQFVIEREHLEEPEFLKIRDDEEPEPEAISETPISETSADEVEISPQPHVEEPGSVEEHEPDAADTDSAITAESKNSTLTSDPAEETRQEVDETTPLGRVHTEDPGAELSAETTEQASPPAEQATVSSTDPTPAVSAAEFPAPIARPSSGGSTAAKAKTEPIAHPPNERYQHAPAEPERKPTTRAARIWGVLGMFLFGLLTVLGLGVTIMAVLLFFTTNDLLVETKIAGVILTGTITLLSLLIMVFSYRTYRKNG